MYIYKQLLMLFFCQNFDSIRLIVVIVLFYRATIVIEYINKR